MFLYSNFWVQAKFMDRLDNDNELQNLRLKHYSKYKQKQRLYYNENISCDYMQKSHNAILLFYQTPDNM